MIAHNQHPPENYANAKTLGLVYAHGVPFRICREHVNGKPWRKYLCLVFDDFAIASDRHERERITDIEQFMLIRLTPTATSPI